MRYIYYALTFTWMYILITSGNEGHWGTFTASLLALLSTLVLVAAEAYKSQLTKRRGER